MFSQLGTLSWFLKRPKLYPELLRAVSNKLEPGSQLADSRLEAMAWCEANATSMAVVAEAITGRQMPCVSELFPHTFQQARHRAEACPVRMGGAGALDLLYALAEYVGATRIVETGVAYGWSSLALLLSLRRRPQ